MSADVETGVYKYCDEHGPDILRNLELKFTPPDQFNDPFEFTPRMIDSNPVQTAKRHLKDKAQNRVLYENVKAAGRFTGSFREFRRALETQRPRLLKAIVANADMAANVVQANILNLVSKSFGVLCLSSRRDSLLMWGHYCDKHRGIVIGFDNQHPYFSDKSGLKVVDYVRTRIVLDANWKDGTKEALEYGKRVVFSKNEDWRYENELRLIQELSLLKQRRIHNGRLGYFASFPAVAIQTVTLGAKCTQQFEEAVRTVLRDEKLSHVKLKRAVLHPSEFALKFEECTR